MSKKYPGFRITVIHAITAIGEDDEEGIPAITTPLMGTMPLLAANEERLELITMAAQQIADMTGQNFKITRFSVREDIGEIVPKTSS